MATADTDRLDRIVDDSLNIAARLRNIGNGTQELTIADGATIVVAAELLATLAGATAELVHERRELEATIGNLRARA